MDVDMEVSAMGEDREMFLGEAVSLPRLEKLPNTATPPPPTSNVSVRKHLFFKEKFFFSCILFFIFPFFFFCKKTPTSNVSATKQRQRSLQGRQIKLVNDSLLGLSKLKLLNTATPPPPPPTSLQQNTN